MSAPSRTLARQGRAATRIGPGVADDGTPAGYPYEDADNDLTVVRFDAVATGSRPVANLVNYNLHGEGSRATT